MTDVKYTPEQVHELNALVYTDTPDFVDVWGDGAICTGKRVPLAKLKAAIAIIDAFDKAHGIT